MVGFMRFGGEVGRELNDRVAHCRHWLAGAKSIRDLRGDPRRRAEEELIAFLLNARFGESEILKQGFESQLDYIRQMHSWNPRCFKLLVGEEPLVATVDMPGVAPIVLGYAAGVSMVVPMSEAGYRAYLNREIWSLEIRREHVVPPEQMSSGPWYLYMGTLFHFPAMPRLLGEDGGGRLIETEGTPPTSEALLRQLFRHLARFFPRLRYDRASRRCTFAQGGDPGRLPTFFCATDSGFGERLATEAGFLFHDLNKLGLPLFQLRLADVNDPAQDADRRDRIGDTIRVYRSLLKKKAR